MFQVFFLWYYGIGCVLFLFFWGGHPSRQVFHVFPGCIKIQVTKSPLQLLVELIASPGIPETFWWKHQVQGIDIALTYGAGELVTRLFTARQANLSPLQVQNLKHTIHLVYIYATKSTTWSERCLVFFAENPFFSHTWPHLRRAVPSLPQPREPVGCTATFPFQL